MVTVNDMFDSPTGRAMAERAERQREENRRMSEALFPTSVEDQAVTAVDELAVLEQRVGEKWAAAVATRIPDWLVPHDPFDSSAWTTPAVVPQPDVPQFPREQWASYPTKRRVVLAVCEKLLDTADLSDEQWVTLCFLMQYGGKTRLS